MTLGRESTTQYIYTADLAKLEGGLELGPEQPTTLSMISVSTKGGYLDAAPPPPIQVYLHSITASIPKRGWAAMFDYCTLLHQRR